MIGVIAGAVVGAVFCCLLLLLVILLVRRSQKKKARKVQSTPMNNLSMPVQTTQYSSVPSAQQLSGNTGGAAVGSDRRSAKLGTINRELEVNWNEISIERELGRGSFGVVYLGTFRHQQVAVKELLSSDLSGTAQQQQQEFMKEATVMSQVKPHKVSS
jgi:hypothetical protein